MTALEKLITEIQEQNRTERQPQHTQTVSLSQSAHNKLTRLSEHLQTSKTSLASKFLIAAIDDAYTKVIPTSPIDQFAQSVGKAITEQRDDAIRAVVTGSQPKQKPTKPSEG
jgi:hypothetical protein